MGGSLNQPCRVEEGGLEGRKLLLTGSSGAHAWAYERTGGISIG